MGPADRVLTPKGAATRRRIVEGAAAQIRRRGLASTTLDDIVAATSTSKGQLFHYFPDGREQLLLAVAEHEADQVIADQEPHLSRLASWADWEAWRSAVVERYRAQGVHCPLGVLLTELRGSSPGAMLVTEQLLRRWQQSLEAGITGMRQAGLMPYDIVPGDVAATLIAAIQGGVVILLSTGEIGHLEKALVTILGLLRSA